MFTNDFSFVLLSAILVVAHVSYSILLLSCYPLDGVTLEILIDLISYSELPPDESLCLLIKPGMLFELTSSRLVLLVVLSAGEK